MTDKTVKRLVCVLERLRTYRPAQWVCYATLVLWSLYTLLCGPTSPIVRYMPGWVYKLCVTFQLVAPLVSFVGQWVQHRYPLIRRQVENGWWLQAGADAAIWWTIGVTIMAFAQATDNPYAHAIIGFLIAMTLASLLLVLRDVLEIIACRCLRRRACEASANEL